MNVSRRRSNVCCTRAAVLRLSPLLFAAFAVCGWAQEATPVTLQATSQVTPREAVRLSQQQDRPRAIGDATRALLAEQADGTHAGAALPMLGETATLSYRRYAQSFSHPIPLFFDQAVSAEHSK